MNNTQLENKLKTLKELIKNINKSAVNLIHLSAEIELELRTSSGSESAGSLENKIDKLINQYQNYLK